MRDVVLYAARLERWRDGAARPLADLGGEIVGSAGDRGGLSLLLAAPGDAGAECVAERLERAGSSVGELVEVGSHADAFPREIVTKLA